MNDVPIKAQLQQSHSLRHGVIIGSEGSSRRPFTRRSFLTTSSAAGVGLGVASV